MIYIIKQKGLCQNKVNSSLVSTCNCKIYVILNGYPLNIHTPHFDDLLNSCRKFSLGLNFKLILRTFSEIELSLMRGPYPLENVTVLFFLFRKEAFTALFIRKLFHLPYIYDVCNSPFTRQRIIGRFFYIIPIVL